MNSPRLVSCPTCGELTPWIPENRFRPFCSERCKTQDLAAWAKEEFRVAQQEGNADPSAGENPQ